MTIMMKNEKWSQTAWKAVEPIYDAILNLPFIKQLSDGTLDKNVFERYIRQDSLYINIYSKVLAHIASRLPETEMTEAFLGFALEGTAAERSLHSRFIEARIEGMSPACRFYTALLQAQAQASVEVEAAAVLPCFWIYLKVGLEIASKASSTNPYHEWISMYSQADFVKSTEKAIRICDALAENADEDTRKKMIEIFVECTRLEWLFWHSAYNDLKWKV